MVDKVPIFQIKVFTININNFLFRNNKKIIKYKIILIYSTNEQLNILNFNIEKLDVYFWIPTLIYLDFIFGNQITIIAQIYHFFFMFEFCFHGCHDNWCSFSLLLDAFLSG